MQSLPHVSIQLRIMLGSMSVVYVYMYSHPSTPPPPTTTTPRVSYLGRWWSSPWGDRLWWVPPHRPPAWTELGEGSFWCSLHPLCIPDQELPPDWPPKKETRVSCEMFPQEYTVNCYLPVLVDAFATTFFFLAFIPTSKSFKIGQNKNNSKVI